MKNRVKCEETCNQNEKSTEEAWKKGYLLALDHVGPDLIDFYPVDAFVNTACPRIAIDDAVKYAKPLITPFELEVSLGEKKWENGYNLMKYHEKFNQNRLKA